MRITGKVVGGAIGFAMAGPLGAVAGAFFGHAYDLGDQEVQNGRSDCLSMIAETQLAIFVTSFSMLAKLAQADGRLNHAELNAIETFAIRDLGLKPAEREVAFTIFHTALQSPASFEQFASQFHQNFHKRPQMLEKMIDVMIRVSVADGPFNACEEDLVLNAVSIFHLSAQRYGQLKRRYMAAKDFAYYVLGCLREDSDDNIKRKYRVLVQTHHPDKVSAKGLPQADIQAAHEKFHEIQSAYEQIKKERGMR